MSDFLKARKLTVTTQIRVSLSSKAADERRLDTAGESGERAGQENGTTICCWSWLPPLGEIMDALTLQQYSLLQRPQVP